MKIYQKTHSRTTEYNAFPNQLVLIEKPALIKIPEHYYLDYTYARLLLLKDQTCKQVAKE
jgi:hypothetical protein